MSLSRVALRPSAPMIVIFRRAASGSSPGYISKIQLTKPANEQGFFAYARNWSRDPKKAKGMAVPQMGDLPSTFMLRRLSHAYEIYPLIFLMSAWFVFFCGACYWSFGKIEIWLDRSQATAPWDWTRIRDSYWKKPTVIADFDGRTRKRCELMEMLQDEMIEAAKKRGTR